MHTCTRNGEYPINITCSDLHLRCYYVHWQRTTPFMLLCIGSRWGYFPRQDIPASTPLDCWRTYGWRRGFNVCHSNIHHRTNATRGAIPWQTCPPESKYSEDVCLVIVKIDLLARCIFGGGNGEFLLPSDGKVAFRLIWPLERKWCSGIVRVGICMAHEDRKD